MRRSSNPAPRPERGDSQTGAIPRALNWGPSIESPTGPVARLNPKSVCVPAPRRTGKLVADARAQMPGGTAPLQGRRGARAHRGCGLQHGGELAGIRTVRRTGPALRERPRRRSPRRVGGRGSQLSSQSLVGWNPRPSLVRRGALPRFLGSPRRVEPHPASFVGPLASGQGLAAEDRGHRARGPALAPSDVGFALCASGAGGGDRLSRSFAPLLGSRACVLVGRRFFKAWC